MSNPLAADPGPPAADPGNPGAEVTRENDVPHTADTAWVYLLRCHDGSLYTGWTSDLERRLRRHAAGRASRYTASRRPVALELAMVMPDRSAARREEARIKRLTRAQKLTLVARHTAAQSPSTATSAGR